MRVKSGSKVLKCSYEPGNLKCTRTNYEFDEYSKKAQVLFSF